MLKDVNDSIAQAKQLVELIKDFPSLVNIIPFNPWPGSQYQCSSHDQIVRFAKAVEDAGINAPIRWPRGRDILAACGQLKTEESKKRQDAKLLANSVPASSEAVL
jgi:23S rRNA (adenine2503-C2)-methyltransferase